jgi:hypothetical protein
MHTFVTLKTEILRGKIMKVFLLAVTILLLINRIKSTPRMLSRTLYESNFQKSIDKLRKQINDIETVSDKNTVLQITQYMIAALVWLYSLLIIIYYILIGNRFQSNTIMLMLTAFQIVTMFISTKRTLKEFDLVNLDNMNSNVKFNRSWFLFNVVLDYAYYPMTIYLLLNV